MSGDEDSVAEGLKEMSVKLGACECTASTCDFTTSLLQHV